MIPLSASPCSLTRRTIDPDVRSLASNWNVRSVALAEEAEPELLVVVTVVGLSKDVSEDEADGVPTNVLPLEDSGAEMTGGKTVDKAEADCVNVNEMFELGKILEVNAKDPAA